MLARLRLDFSHLCEHKFRNGFKDALNPLCSCSMLCYVMSCILYFDLARNSPI